MLLKELLCESLPNLLFHTATLKRAIQINEIRATNLQPQWEESDDFISVTFETLQGSEVEVTFENDEDGELGWHIEFTVDNRITPKVGTVAKDAHQIIAGVLNTINEFINKINPDTMSLICSSPSLYRLYSRIVQNPVVSSRYNIQQTTIGGSDPWYILTKK